MKFRYLGIIVLGLLISCAQQPQQKIELKALDEFFDRLLQNSEKVVNWDTKVYKGQQR